MPRVTKTIEYAFDTNTQNLASNTTYTSSTKRIIIPENNTTGTINPVTFRSVILRVFYRDNVLAATNMTSTTIGVVLGSASASTRVINPFTATNSGENQPYITDVDFTSYFNTNFGSNYSQSCYITVIANGAATNNITAKLIITYEYDSECQTKIKTVKIPIESITGSVNTTMTKFGENQIPNLDLYLPEQNKVYRNIFYELYYNTYMATNAVTTSNPTLSLSGGIGTTSTGIHQASQISSLFNYHIFNCLSFDGSTSQVGSFATGATDDLYLQSSNSGSTFRHPAVFLNITYEYNSPSSTSIFNSIQIPFKNEMYYNGHSSTEVLKIPCKFTIQEKNIQLKQSGIFINNTNANSSDINVFYRAGNQSYYAYNEPNSSNHCGGISLIRRIDISEQTGHTLTRGKNEIVLSNYQTSPTTWMGNPQAILYLNYVSDKHSAGEDYHNKTLTYTIKNGAARSAQFIGSATKFISFAEENSFYLTNIGLVYFAVTQQTQTHVYFFDAQTLTGEINGYGYEKLMTVASRAIQENGVNIFCNDVTDKFNLYPGFTGNMSLTGTRLIRLNAYSTPTPDSYFLMTIHGITYGLTGKVNNYTGNGSGININIYEESTGKLLKSTTTTLNGNFSTHWYDNTVPVFCSAKLNSRRVGRSDSLTAV